MLKREIRAKIGIFVIAAGILYSNIQFLALNYMIYTDKMRMYSDSPQRKELVGIKERYKLLKKSLPEHGRVGFITDDINRAYNSGADYFYAQYMLIPVLVLNSSKPDIFVSRFYNPVKPEFLKEKKLEIVKDFGGGVMLLRKRGS